MQQHYSEQRNQQEIKTSFTRMWFNKHTISTAYRTSHGFFCHNYSS